MPGQCSRAGADRSAARVHRRQEERRKTCWRSAGQYHDLDPRRSESLQRRRARGAALPDGCRAAAGAAASPEAYVGASLSQGAVMSHGLAGRDRGAVRTAAGDPDVTGWCSGVHGVRPADGHRRRAHRCRMRDIIGLLRVGLSQDRCRGTGAADEVVTTAAGCGRSGPRSVANRCRMRRSGPQNSRTRRVRQDPDRKKANCLRGATARASLSHPDVTETVSRPRGGLRAMPVGDV